MNVARNGSNAQNERKNETENDPDMNEINKLKGNGLRKSLVIGKTGTWKSSLCNVLAGREHDDDDFAASSDAESCTQSTKFADIFLNGDPCCWPISLFDTIGFDDPTKDHDVKIIVELVAKLKNNCDYINLSMITVNGQAPWLDGSLLTMLNIFEGMFDKDIWKQVVVVFTRVQMDNSNKYHRESVNQKTDDELAQDYVKVVEAQFPDCTGLRYLYMDAT